MTRTTVMALLMSVALPLGALAQSDGSPTDAAATGMSGAGESGASVGETPTSTGTVSSPAPISRSCPTPSIAATSSSWRLPRTPDDAAVTHGAPRSRVADVVNGPAPDGRSRVPSTPNIASATAPGGFRCPDSGRRTAPRLSRIPRP